MRHVRQIELTKEDMNMVLDLVGISFLKTIINESEYASFYPSEIKNENALYFLKNHLHKISTKSVLKKFYRKLNNSILNIDDKLRWADEKYEEVLGGKNLIGLRNLFEYAELDSSEMRATPLLLKCLGMEYTKSIAFTIDNELYIRKRIDKLSKKEVEKSTENVNKINKLMLELKEAKLNIIKKNERISALKQITKDLEFELTQYNPEIGYYSELTQTDYVKIIKDLGKHSSEVKEKFKQLIEKFEENENEPEDKLYEMWMEWTDEEVTILDDILKKSMYEEVIKRTDLNDLEYISENIMNRYLLSRLLLHFIYRRMSSQCWEEVLG